MLGAVEITLSTLLSLISRLASSSLGTMHLIDLGQKFFEVLLANYLPLWNAGNHYARAVGPALRARRTRAIWHVPLEFKNSNSVDTFYGFNICIYRGEIINLSFIESMYLG